MLNNQELILKAQDRINRKGINYSEFISKLIENKGVISGSFCLQILLDEIYESSDIDIFISSNNYIDFIEYLKTLQPVHEYEHGSQKDCESIIDSRTFFYDSDIKAKINVIIVNGDIDFHIQYFDLSFCRVKFDGENFSYSEDDLNKEGTINSLDSFIGSYRYIFYKNSGAYFSDESILQRYLKVLSERIVKYYSRGFKIKNLEVMRKYFDYNDLLQALKEYQ